MKRIVLSMRDVKIGEYLNLVYVKNRAEAQRHFLVLMGAEGSPLNKFPRDYQIHCIGTFDTETGAIVTQIPEDMTPYTEIERADNERRTLEAWKASNPKPTEKVAS